MGVLEILAAVAILAGSVQTTIAVSDSNRLDANSTKESAVEMQAIRPDATDPAIANNF